MGVPVSKILCLAVLAFAPACVDQPDNDTGGIQLGTTKYQVAVGDDDPFVRPAVLPPKPRVREDAFTATVNHSDYLEEINDGGDSIDPMHVTSIGDVVPVALLLHHFDADGVEHITRLDENALRGE